jgi:hypothetical protein
MLTSPLFAVVVCAVGGPAIWYYGAAPTMVTPAAKPNSGRTTLERTRAVAPRTPVSDRLAATTKSVKSPNSHRAPSPAARTQREHAAPKDTINPREDVANAELTAPTRTSGQENNEHEETKQAGEPPVDEREVIASNSTEPASPKKEKFSPTSPEGVLDSKGLRKFGSYYVVATEKAIGEGFGKIKPIYNVMDAALGQFQAILNAEMNYLYWDNERTLAQTYIGDLNIAIANTPNTIPNRLTIQQLQRELSATQLYLNNVFGALELARKNLVPPAKKQAVWDEFVMRRADFLEANKLLRPIVDKANAEYAALKADPAVKDALQTLSKHSNSPVKLGPSKPVSTAISSLIRAERAVSFDPDSYRRKNKRKSKIAQGADARD